MVLGRTVQLGLVVIVLGILGMVGVNIMEKTSDKTALTANDTFYNASLDVVDTVETGYDYMPLILLAIAAGLVITAIFMGIPIKF